MKGQEFKLVLFCCIFNECGKSFRTKFNLKRHIETTHIKLKKFKCDVCSKLYSSKQNLIEHRYLHTGERPFHCEVCLENFRQASQLSLHKRTHKAKRSLRRQTYLTKTPTYQPHN